MDSSWGEDFVLALTNENDDLLDENENYKHKQTNVQCPVDPTPPNLDVDEKPCFRIKSEVDASQYYDASERPENLSEYFPALPLISAPSAVEFAPDDAAGRMVNVPLLLSQLFNARVVINRLPEEKIQVKIEPSTSKTVSVQRYCCKCKTFNVDYTMLTRPKRCSKCYSTLLYVCEKCNENHYHTYRPLLRHRTICKGEKTGKSLDDVFVMLCAECSFKTSYQYIMKAHLKNTSHKLLDGEPLDEKLTEKEIDLVEFTVKRNDVCVKNAYDRYCLNCEKIVEGFYSNNKASNKAICDTCNTTLVYQCKKCDKQSANSKSIWTHVKRTCYPDIYCCRNCKYTTPRYDTMRRHVTKVCQNKIAFQKISREKRKFMCEHCSFRSNDKKTLRSHLKKSHRE